MSERTVRRMIADGRLISGYRPPGSRFVGVDLGEIDQKMWLVLTTRLKCSSHDRIHHLFKTFRAGPAGWTEQQLPDGTIVWTSPRGRTYPTQPLGALFFPQLAMPTGKLTLPNSPPAGPHRELAMPARRRTRAEDRARRVQWERALNRARYDADPPPF